MTEPRSHTWVWQFDSPVDSVWPILADTARFNEAAGLPNHEIEEQPQADGSVRFFGRARMGLVHLAWEEQPVTWVHRRWFEHCRHFSGGPFKYLCAKLKIFPDGTGCVCEYTVTVKAANWLGVVILATGFFSRIGKTFTPLAESAAEFARGARETPFACKPRAVSSDVRQRVAAMVEAIEATPHGHGLAGRLASLVLTGQEVDVWSIRPLKLAKEWGAPERHAIELCLEAVKQGLLRLRWDLLCPRCQVGKSTVPALDQLPAGAHCPSCNIDYDRDYTSNVELAFHPANAIRPLQGGEYCLFGPMGTPHIKVQLTLEAGEVCEVEVALEHGRYRLRTLEPGGEKVIEWQAGGFPEVVVDGESVDSGPPATEGTLVLSNRSTSRKLTIIVEELAWMRDALTAKQVTAMQAFRDLFNEDVLRPGDNVEIDYITIMFTDLKGSTALYERIGDPEAYYLVREHFAILGGAVRENNGAVVKTIGDAIMAVFTDPADALRCATRIHADFEAFNASSGKEPILVKLGLHVGRCISVTLNNRLDYYGTEANKAARLEGQSRGGDVVMSPEFVADPVVARLLAGFTPERETAELKGFNAPVVFYRLSAEELAAKRRAVPA